jgi:hypothetical protein
MTLTAPSRLNRQRGFLTTGRLHRTRSTTPTRALPSAAAAPGQVVLMVDLISPEGRTWWAVGLGDTLAEALAFAQDSCPTDSNWQPVRWNELYGD